MSAHLRCAGAGFSITINRASTNKPPRVCSATQTAGMGTIYAVLPLWCSNAWVGTASCGLDLQHVTAVVYRIEHEDIAMGDTCCMERLLASPAHFQRIQTHIWARFSPCCLVHTFHSTCNLCKHAACFATLFGDHPNPAIHLSWHDAQPVLPGERTKRGSPARWRSSMRRH